MAHAPASDSDQTKRQEAREWVIQRLALVSTVIWVIAVLIFLVGIYPSYYFRPSSGMMAGMIALGIAAIPWLAFRPLVDRQMRQRAPR